MDYAVAFGLPSEYLGDVKDLDSSMNFLCRIGMVEQL